MTLPIATTTITLLRPASAEDWGGSPAEDAYVDVPGRPIRAVIGRPSGQSIAAAEGSSVSYSYPLVCDPCDISEDMQIRDNGTGFVYEVAEVGHVAAPLVGHIAATLRRVKATF